jgi:S-formylglutathione hydrolase FrmB
MTRLHLALLILILVFPVQALAGHRSAASVETIPFSSKLINTRLPYNVILPRDYKTARTTRYPVLYLLHGLTGHYNDWIARTNIADYAAQ